MFKIFCFIFIFVVFHLFRIFVCKLCVHIFVHTDIIKANGYVYFEWNYDCSNSG